jgi:hypothetical protein
MPAAMHLLRVLLLHRRLQRGVVYHAANCVHLRPLLLLMLVRLLR